MEEASSLLFGICCGRARTCVPNPLPFQSLEKLYLQRLLHLLPVSASVSSSAFSSAHLSLSLSHTHTQTVAFTHTKASSRASNAMAVLASTFLDCSLACSQRSSPVASRKSLLLAASARKIDEEQHVQHRKAKASPSSSWISFFLFGSSQNSSMKPLLEDESAAPADEAGSMEASSMNLQTDQVKMPSKKGPKGRKRVSFTPQKARELRQKLKDSDTFHDLMYHSAIASRLASRDS